MKKNHWLKLGAAIVALAVVTPTFAQEVMRHVPPKRDALSQWCNDALRILNRARLDADSAYYRGELEAAKHTLIAGLSRAQETNAFRQNGPLTAKAIARGVTLANEIDRATAGALNGNRTTVYFLFRYFDFIDHVANQLDYPFFIPFRNCGNCRLVEEAAFERRFTDYTKEQLQLVLETLAEATEDPRRGVVFPVGTQEAFLRALELSSLNAAQDLRESLWATRNACQIDALYDLADRIGSNAFFNDVDAVNSSYLLASDILAEIRESGRGCGRR